MKERLQNINVLSSEILPTPEEIKQALPLPAASEEFVYRSRGAVRRILDREDPRLFVVVGPCSIHDIGGRPGLCTAPEGARGRVVRTRCYWSCASISRSRAPPSAGRASSTIPTWTTPSTSRRASHMARQLLLDLAETRPAGGDRGARPDHAAVPVGPDHLDRDRRAHHRIADPSRDGERPVHAGRLQERHRRRRWRWRSTRCKSARQPAPFPRHQPGRPVGRDPHPRQPLRPHRAARRRRAPELRFGERRAVREGTATRRGCRPTS